jgi:phosphate transport system permease protein
VSAAGPVVAPAAARPVGQRADLTGAGVSPGRAFRNAVATGLMWAAVAIALIPLVFVLAYVASKGGSVISWAFLTKRIPLQGATKGPGMGPAVFGTLLITLAATLMAVPLGVLGAIYIVEYGAANRLASLVQFMSDVMAGVPSIVMGLFIYTVWVLRFKGNGQTALAGALALACLMLPIVIRSTESMLRLVPPDLREASYALGSSKSRTILTVVLPAAVAGITSGCLLAVARAAGETAPLLFTIGIVSRTNHSLFKGPNTTLSAQIFTNATSIFAPARDRAWGAALTLIGLVLVLTVVARVVSRRLTVR